MALFVAAASRTAPASAFPLRVVAASELRVEPRLSSDQRTLTLALRLRDDRGAALAGRVVRVRLRAESFPFYAEAVRSFVTCNPFAMQLARCGGRCPGHASSRAC